MSQKQRLLSETGDFAINVFRCFSTGRQTRAGVQPRAHIKLRVSCFPCHTMYRRQQVKIRGGSAINASRCSLTERRTKGDARLAAAIKPKGLCLCSHMVRLLPRLRRLRPGFTTNGGSAKNALLFSSTAEGQTRASALAVADTRLKGSCSGSRLMRRRQRTRKRDGDFAINVFRCFSTGRQTRAGVQPGGAHIKLRDSCFPCHTMYRRQQVKIRG